MNTRGNLVRASGRQRLSSSCGLSSVELLAASGLLVAIVLVGFKILADRGLLPAVGNIGSCIVGAVQGDTGACGSGPTPTAAGQPAPSASTPAAPSTPSGQNAFGLVQPPGASAAVGTGGGCGTPGAAAKCAEDDGEVGTTGPRVPGFKNCDDAKAYADRYAASVAARLVEVQKFEGLAEGFAAQAARWRELSRNGTTDVDALVRERDRQVAQWDRDLETYGDFDNGIRDRDAAMAPGTHHRNIALHMAQLIETRRDQMYARAREQQAAADAEARELERVKNVMARFGC